MKVREVLGRGDYALITELIPKGVRVLDLGCGDGALLEWLKRKQGVEARGIEIRRELVQQAIERGVTVYQGELEASLVDYPDDAFDYAILSQTLQETRSPKKVLEQMLRIAKHAVVAFPNFGQWRVRLAHMVSGRAPKTQLFPYEWYDSPNIHFLTVIDFEEMVTKEGWIVERKLFLSRHRKVKRLPNLMAEIAVYQLRRRD